MVQWESASECEFSVTSYTLLLLSTLYNYTVLLSTLYCTAILPPPPHKQQQVGHNFTKPHVHNRKKLSKFSQHPDWLNASNYVAKRYMKEASRETYFEDVKLQMDSKLWGEEYNKLEVVPKKVHWVITYGHISMHKYHAYSSHLVVHPAIIIYACTELCGSKACSQVLLMCVWDPVVDSSPLKSQSLGSALMHI